MKKSSPKFLLAIDAGSTGIRATIFDHQCKEVGKVYEKLQTTVGGNGVFETDANIVFETVVLASKKVMKQTGLNPKQMAGIGITNQRSTFTCWDEETGQSLHPFISWADLRGTEVCETANQSIITHLLRGVCTVLYWVTRMPLMLTISHLTLKNNQLGPKLCWVVKNIPEVTECLNRKKLKVGTMDSWILHKLSGHRIHATDASNASSTGVFDPYGMSWSPIAGIMVYPYRYVPTSVFPTVKSSHDDFGSTDPSIFGHPIPIISVIADQQSAMFGHGCTQRGDTKVTLGTGGFVDCTTGSKALASYGTLYPLVAWKMGSKVTYCMEGPDTTAGLGIEWLVRVGILDSALNSESIAESVPDSGGVYFIPALFGLAAPHWDDHARAMFIGMTAATSRAHLVRAALECYAFRVNEILSAFFNEVMPQSEHTGKLHISGGMANNNFVCQAISDITGLEVIRPVNTETTSIGLAFMMGIQAGMWKEDEIDEYRKIDRVFKPSLNAEQRNARINQWSHAVMRSSKWAKESTEKPPASNLSKVVKVIVIIWIFCGFLGFLIGTFAPQLFLDNPWFEIKISQKSKPPTASLKPGYLH